MRATRFRVPYIFGSIAIGTLSLLSSSSAQAQSPGGNLGALLARMQADEASMATLQGTVASLQSTVTSQQNTINQMTSTGVKPSGPAGGDLIGIYPSPTIAVNAITSSKLASDPASLGQVTNGSMATFANNRNVGTWPNSYIGPNSTDYFNYESSPFGNAGLGWYADTWNGGNGLTAWISGYGGIKLFTASTPRLSITASGNVGIGVDNPQAALEVQGNVWDRGTNFSLVGGGGGVGNNGGNGRALVDGGVSGLFVNYNNDFGKVTIQSDTTIIGTMTANSLQITGGSDLAEPYIISTVSQTKILPGMVVSIDPQQTGQMRVCSHAYDNTVGGIISGANGVHPGVVLRQAGTVADGALPVASVGRVWCYCDANAGGAIAPGDLLTTSETPGHAMRVADYNKARGAVLGKAMSSLKRGKGLVLVLVTLE